MSESIETSTYTESIKATTSSQIAAARIRALKNQDLLQATNPSQKRIPNPTPPDNNIMWEGYHNPLSSKGD